MKNIAMFRKMKNLRVKNMMHIGVIVCMLLFLTACLVDFEDPPLNTIYNVGDSFIDSGVKITVLPFQWADGTWTNAGFARVANGGLAGGSLQEIQVYNVNLGFKFATSLNKLKMNFGEYGGNLNISVNGVFRNFANFSNLLPGPLGGCNVNVINGFGNDMGVLELNGNLSDFSTMQGQYTFVVGGQELWIDNVETDP